MATGGGGSIPTVDHEEFFDWACAKCRDNDRITEAVFFCPDCDEAFCDACVKDHNRFLRKHVVSGRAKKSDWGKTSRPRGCEDECQEHRGETISIYCGRHDDVCCPSCALWKHTDECKSSMLPVCEMLQSLDFKANVNKAMDDADKLMTRFSSTEHDIYEMLLETKSDRDTCLSEIETFSHTITSHINQLKELEIIKANKLYGDRERELEKDQQTCKDKIRELQQLKLKLQETDSVSDATVFVRTKTSQRRLVESSKESAELSHQRNIKFSFKRNPIVTQIECRASNLGSFYDEGSEPSVTVLDVPYENTRTYKASIRNVTAVHVESMKQKQLESLSANNVTVEFQKPRNELTVTAPLLKQIYQILDNFDALQRESNCPSGGDVSHDKSIEQVRDTNDISEVEEIQKKQQFDWNSQAEYFKQFTTGEGIIVKVYKDNILNLQVECIVSASNERLQHAGGVARVIADAAGDDLVQDGDKFIRSVGKLPVGMACTTTAGRLPYKFVIHAVGPAWYNYQPFTQKDVVKCENDLYNAIKNSFREAVKRNVSSIALPAISSAIFGVPEEICVYQYALATVAYSRDSVGTKTRLREIHFIDINPKIIMKIQDMFERVLLNPSRPYSIMKYVKHNSKSVEN